jgi:hypothetical protein
MGWNGVSNCRPTHISDLLSPAFAPQCTCAYLSLHVLVRQPRATSGLHEVDQVEHNGIDGRGGHVAAIEGT